MEKFEYQTAIEKMLEYVSNDDYTNAAKIADRIDWKTENSITVLNTVSNIYEEAGRYNDARDILYIIHKNKRANNTALFNLTRLDIYSNKITDAYKNYNMFVKQAPNDANRYILEYLLKKATNEPIEAQIEALEKYKELDYNEKWAYELAKLYNDAGMQVKCIQECDDIELWFSNGKYVKKAMELKKRYKQLEPFQIEALNSSGDEEFSKAKESAKLVLDERIRLERVRQERRNQEFLHHKAQYQHVSLEEPQDDYEDDYEEVPTYVEDSLSIPSVSKPVETPDLVVDITPDDTKSVTQKLIELARLENTGTILLRATNEDNRHIQRPPARAVYNEDIDINPTTSYEEENDYEVEQEEESAPNLYDQISDVADDEEYENTYDMPQDYEEYEGDDSEDIYDDDYEEEYEEPNKKHGLFSKIFHKKDRDDYEEYPDKYSEDFFNNAHNSATNDDDDLGLASLQDRLGQNKKDFKEVPVDRPQSSAAKQNAASVYDTINFQAEIQKNILAFEAENEFKQEEHDIRELHPPEFSNIKREEVKEKALHHTQQQLPIMDEQLNNPTTHHTEDVNSEPAETKVFDASKRAEERDNKIAEERRKEVPKEPAKEYTQSLPENETSYEQEFDEEYIPEELFPEDDDIKEVFTEVDPDHVIPEKDISNTQEGFVMKEVFDLESQSHIGTQAGLTEDEKAIFTYFVPVRGMSEQIVKVLDDDEGCERKGTSRIGNLIIVGESGAGKTALAIDVIKARQKVRHKRKGKVAIMDGEALNNKDIHETIRRMHGGSLIIESAGDLNSDTISRLNVEMEMNTGELFIVLEDHKEDIEKMLKLNNSFAEKFNLYLDIPTFNNDELVTFGQAYAKEYGFKIDEMAILALYARIEEMQRDDYNVSVAEVARILDEAIKNSKKDTVKKSVKTFLKSKEVNDKKLNEEDFDDKDN